MLWRKPTKAEIDGKSNWDVIIDVTPGYVVDETADFDERGLIRTARPGWEWWARSIGYDGKSPRWLNEGGNAETKEEAIEAALTCVRRYRARTKLL